MSVDYRPDYDPADVDHNYGHTGGDITVPTFTGDTRPFRFWCQKALPLVYDDSLSYYEVLCKMADYMNNFMTDLTTVEDSMTEFGQQFVINQQFLNSMADQLGQNVADLEAYINDRMDDFMTAYTQLQTYVNNYFDNLDVQEEINAKLDEMASDGTLNDLFDPVLETWMQQKTAQIDAAIANQNTIQAAQNARISVLEGRMDTFSGLPSGSTSGNAELLDIRTNFLGETYPTAGDAVRASDMIASGFQSIGFSRLTEWNGNESDSRFDTIQIDVSAYKGGHMVVIANTYQFVNDIEQGAGIELFGTNVAGKTVDSNAHQYPFPDGVSGIPSPVFKDFTVLTTSVQDEERILIQLAIPEDFQYQYLKLGNVAPIPGEGYSYTQPAAIVYANSWSKTQVDPTLTIAGAAADAKAAGDAIDELNERIDDVKSDLNTKVDLNGENQVTPQNIAGMQFTKTEETVDGENIFSADMLFRNGQYVISADRTVSVGSNASFNAYCVPVEQNSTYVFPECRFVVLATGNMFNSPTIGDTIQNATQVNTGEATYLFLSYANKPVGEITVKKRETGTVYSDFVLPDWLVDNLPIPTVVEKTKFATVTGDIASGGNLQLTSPKNNLRKGERIVFEGNITSFDTIRIGLSFSTAVDTDSNQINTFRIDGTNISYYARSNSTPVIVPHGLPISGNIQVIWEMSAVATCKITLISDGNLFAHEFTNFVRQTVGNPFVLSDGTVLTDCKLTWACNDIDKPIWMFGDSYFAYSDARWTYYLHQYGYDQNCLLDGFPGEGGVNGRVAFNNLLQFGTPKYAVWCLGMNDGSDSDSAPSADWVSTRDYFLQYCTNNNVTPIFGTIPTVPTINHEQKNAWIRSSGYRYIDFAKAVGANANGVWYSGMLSSDGVHPTAQGARALFARVLLDLPEIMIGGYGIPTAINS